ncbi:unnamed protein product [Dovyalis caffra]|uniref:Uncharacterized protein n=1 Tax=Dovyalis caffra TaxID=77055 RepID=A0AAV1SWE4_9ROSI|nr:unnamed protein product [Dovyalis caffra]
MQIKCSHAFQRDPSKYGAIFEMTVGGSVNYSKFQMPENFSLGVPGYSCGQAIDAIPTKYTIDGGRSLLSTMTQLLLAPDAAAAAKDNLEHDV